MMMVDSGTLKLILLNLVINFTATEIDEPEDADVSLLNSSAAYLGKRKQGKGTSTPKKKSAKTSSQIKRAAVQQKRVQSAGPVPLPLRRRLEPAADDTVEVEYPTEVDSDSTDDDE